MNVADAVKKSRIKRLILELGLFFKEDESRMNYGHIGNLLSKDEVAIVIFPNSFYVHDKELSINEKTLELIQLIQTQLKELQFVDGKPQLLFTKS